MEYNSMLHAIQRFHWSVDTVDFLIKGNLFVTKTGHVLCCFHVSSSLVRLRKMVNVEITMVME